MKKNLQKRWSNHSARGTRGSAEDHTRKEQFYRAGMGAVCAPKPQFSVAVADTFVMGGKMFRQHRGYICSIYDTTHKHSVQAC